MKLGRVGAPAKGGINEERIQGRAQGAALQPPRMAGVIGLTNGRSALARLEPALDLVDHIDPAFAPDQTVGPMATAQRFQ